VTRDEFIRLFRSSPQDAIGLLYDVNHAGLCTLRMPTPSTHSTPAARPATTATSTSSPTPTPAPTPAPAPPPPPPAGDVPPPKYDARVPRRGGFVFASEMLLKDLEWWHERKLEGAAKGGQYAAKDKKLAEDLARFVAWRRVAPAETWRGIRGQKTVTADSPRRDPALRSWEDRAPAKLAPPPPAGGYGDVGGAYSYGGDGADEEIPF
jgi:hypothetical protein